MTTKTDIERVPKGWLTQAAVCRFFSLSTETLLRFEGQGLVEPIRSAKRVSIGRGATRPVLVRYRASDVLRAIEKYGEGEQ